MATKKYKIQQLQSDETLLTLHPETDASIVKVDTSKTGTTATNVEDALKELKDTIGTGSGGVTGVKGSAESSYRKGNVEITKANIGLGNVNNTSDADKPISTAVQAALDTVVQIAEGKTKTYVISASVNLSFASNEDTIKLSMQGTNITTTTGQTSIRLSELKLGDIVLLTDTDYPDRWVSTINGNLMWFDKLETRKIDLSGYATTTDIDKIKNGTTVVKKAEQDSEGNVIKDTYFKKSGGTMNGDINMNGNEISNVSAMSVNEEFSVGSVQEAIITSSGYAITNFDGDKSANFNPENIEVYRNVSNKYVLTFPEKTGTFALTSSTTGTYSAVQVTNGIVTGGAQMFEVGVANQTEPSANLAIGGIFFKEI